MLCLEEIHLKWSEEGFLTQILPIDIGPKSGTLRNLDHLALNTKFKKQGYVP